jgi:lactoylglutathione lyase
MRPVILTPWAEAADESGSVAHILAERPSSLNRAACISGDFERFLMSHRQGSCALHTHLKNCAGVVAFASLLFGDRPTKGIPTMAKLRHIALIVPDPDKAAKFFEEAFDMKIAGRARRGVYVSDGIINVALLKQEGTEKVGIYHFGMWVDDLDEAEKKVQDAGATYLEGRPTSPDSFYECKYKDPLGIIFDLTHKGWKGAVKDVVAKS